MKMVDVRIYTYSRLGQHYESTKHHKDTDKFDVCIGSYMVTIPVPRSQSVDDAFAMNKAFRAAELQREIDALIAERELLEAE